MHSRMVENEPGYSLCCPLPYRTKICQLFLPVLPKVHLSWSGFFELLIPSPSEASTLIMDSMGNAWNVNRECPGLSLLLSTDPASFSGSCLMKNSQRFLRFLSYGETHRWWEGDVFIWCQVRVYYSTPAYLRNNVCSFSFHSSLFVGLFCLLFSRREGRVAGDIFSFLLSISVKRTCQFIFCPRRCTYCQLLIR